MQNLHLPWSSRKARLLCELLAEVEVSLLSIHVTAMTWEDYAAAIRLCRLLGLQKLHLLDLIAEQTKRYCLVARSTMN